MQVTCNFIMAIVNKIAEIERILNTEFKNPVAQQWQAKVKEEVQPYLKGKIIAGTNAAAAMR